VEPVAPGEYVVAAMRARVAVPVEDGAAITVRAALHLPDAVLATNACTVTVRGRAVVDGPGSGAFVEAVDPQAVRVRAVVANDGDGPARAVRVVVPAPAGCVRADGDGAAVLEIERLDPGERAEFAFEARIVAPVAEVRADAGEVRYGDGRRVALPSRDAVALEPVIAPPRVSVTPSRRRADVAVDVVNDGWVDAHDVRVRVALPAALRLVDGSVVVDGVRVDAGSAVRRRTARDRAASAFARLERDGAAPGIVIAAVPARSIVRVEMAALVPAACSDGMIAVTVDAHQIDVPFVPDRVRAVRVRVVDAPRTVSPGEIGRIVARLVNAGDVAETVSVGIADVSVGIADVALTNDTDTPSLTLLPGSVASVELALPVPEDVDDDRALACAVLVRDTSGERARAAFSLVVRDRAWLALEEPPVRDDACVRYLVRNGGSTVARDVVAIFEETRLRAGSIAPGASAAVEVDERLARRGGSLSIAGREALALPPLDDRIPAIVHAALHAPQRVVAGASFSVRLDIDVEDAVDVLAIGVPAVAGCSYVPGSTLLDGRALLDRTGCAPEGASSPLAGDGLSLRGVPAGTRVSLMWSLFADAPCDEALTVGAVLCVDAEGRPVAPVTVTLAARDAFAARPEGLPYHVEACTAALPVTGIESPSPVPVPVPVPVSVPVPMPVSAMSSSAGNAVAPAITIPYDDPVRVPGIFALDAAPILQRERRLAFSMRLDGERIDEIARLLHAVRGCGLVAHLFTLRLFFPDAVDTQDPLVSESVDTYDTAVFDAFGAVRLAVRDVFDRLFVKLRIPGFDVSSDDLDDPSLRSALLVLFERLADAAPDRVVFQEAPTGLDRAQVGRMLAAFADAPYGAPAVMRALVALLPACCDDDPALAAAVRRHALLLDDVLGRYEGLPLELFDDALARREDAALDDARAAVLAALRAHVPPAEVAC
jgi:hypothetical protein